MTVQLTNAQMNAARTLMNSGSYSAFGQVIPGRNLNTLLGTPRMASTKHDLTFDFGYKDDLDFHDLYYMYKRNGVAKAVVNKTVAKTWETMPTLRENEEVHDETGLEAEVRKYFAKIRFWQMLAETDKRGLVGEYSGVIFQLADSKDFEEPVDSVPGGITGLVNLIPAWEGQLHISQWDQNEKSPTYGQPVMMTYTESSVDSEQGKTRSFQVHPSRVYIWSQDRTTFNDSDMEASYNALVDMEKIRGSGGEGFWKNAKSQPVLEADPDIKFGQLAQMLGTDIDGIPDALDNVVADWNKGFDQSLILQGMQAKTLGVTLPQPEEFYNIASREVAASWQMPEKVLFGNQTGERASTEDAQSWNKRNMSRRNNMVIPNTMDVIERLVGFSILPDRDWFLEWEDLTGATEAEKFERADKMSNVNQKNAATGGVVFTEEEIRAEVGMMPRDDGDLDEMIEDKDDIEGGEDE